MVNKANKRLWIIRRLKFLGAQQEDLLDVYTKQVRSVITLDEQLDIERVQKCAAHVILGDGYVSYKEALKTLNIESLLSRRNKLCLKFAKKAESHEKFQHWFKTNVPKPNTRQKQTKYCEVKAMHDRFQKSPLSYLTRILNEHYSKK